ncbi:hypothetical protein B0T26DRAFT_672863 [Lasiosphaeria miniovina]|uniref:Uncharacterized protein n=1 Tax=Lasiosphaeria miniovina TaxID=1954250 RepID=A0AA40EAG7_9PEZI|nr:uncharacterized protein B0T26DRAFT_672863 [Lasiosphaeria miniovina]KAK0728313.1 hypothetical protein B0T26DRAFT_672863 [Lasiosphaeria miniovina]
MDTSPTHRGATADFEFRRYVAYAEYEYEPTPSPSPSDGTLSDTGDEESAGDENEQVLEQSVDDAVEQFWNDDDDPIADCHEGEDSTGITRSITHYVIDTTTAPAVTGRQRERSWEGWVLPRILLRITA